MGDSNVKLKELVKKQLKAFKEDEDISSFSDAVKLLLERDIQLKLVNIIKQLQAGVNLQLVPAPVNVGEES